MKAITRNSSDSLDRQSGVVGKNFQKVLPVLNLAFSKKRLFPFCFLVGIVGEIVFDETRTYQKLFGDFPSRNAVCKQFSKLCFFFRPDDTRPLLAIYADLVEVFGCLCRQGGNVPFDPPWSEEIRTYLEQSQLPGNLRDLQRLAVLVMAWCPDGFTQAGLRSALDEWTRWILSPVQEGLTLGQGTRANRIDWFCSKLAMWAKDQYGTWRAAAEALDCDEKTLRSDVKSK